MARILAPSRTLPGQLQFASRAKSNMGFFDQVAVSIVSVPKGPPPSSSNPA
jgi:hypothetical protein